MKAIRFPVNNKINDIFYEVYKEESKVSFSIFYTTGIETSQGEFVGMFHLVDNRIVNCSDYHTTELLSNKLFKKKDSYFFDDTSVYNLDIEKEINDFGFSVSCDFTIIYKYYPSKKEMIDDFQNISRCCDLLDRKLEKE